MAAAPGMTMVEGAIIIHKIQDKNSRPTMRDLNRYVVKQFATGWYDVGIELDLEYDVLDNIESSGGRSVNCFRETLNHWLLVKKDIVTWKELEVALTNVNRAKLGLDPVDNVYEELKLPHILTVDEEFKDLRGSYLDILHWMPDDYENSIAKLYDYFTDDEIYGILSSSSHTAANKQILDILIERLSCKEDQCILFEQLEEIAVASDKLKDTIQELRSVTHLDQTTTDMISFIKSKATIPQVVIELSDDLSIAYKLRRQGSSYEDEWPPTQFTSIVNLALIHYHNSQPQQKKIEVARQRSRESITPVDPPYSNISTEIKEIFIPEPGKKQPKRILIEGAPGIGKTVLTKEIAYQWANMELLKERKLLFILFLRDPNLSRVKSINEILELFTPNSTSALKEYITENDGINVAFVFDGFDEYPIALQKQSFITDLIQGRIFGNSAVVVTSRPTAAMMFHKIADRRIEILGFPKEERDRYISLSLKDTPDKKQKFNKYIKRHLIINNLCYIPLYLAILMYLFQQNTLPETLTEVNESFIIYTIYRYWKKHKLIPYMDGVMVKGLDMLPPYIYKLVHKLSHLAFKGLMNNQLVFTLDNVTEVCPEVEDRDNQLVFTLDDIIKVYPDADDTGNHSVFIFDDNEKVYHEVDDLDNQLKLNDINKVKVDKIKVNNGFGLLQPVQHYPQGGTLCITVNFRHFTMQEYLAAFYVSTLPYEKQLQLAREKFWDSQFSFMWMMYIGIVGIKSNFFIDFITADKCSSTVIDKHLEIDSKIQMDKRKCLHLFQCYTEAKISTEIPEAISSIFSDGKIFLSNTELSPHHISSLLSFMSTVSMQEWKTLELSMCKVSDIGMNTLLDYFTNHSEGISSLEYVDLSRNKSSPWGVYCAIIRQCCVNSLALCGDEGMNYYVSEISGSLQMNTTIQSLTLGKMGRIGVQSINDVLSKNLTLKKLHMSWKSTGITILHRKFIHSKFTKTKASPGSHRGVVDINIFYDGDCDCSSETIDMSHNHIDDDAVCLIAFGLYDNAIVEDLNLSCNCIDNDGAIFISESLMTNNTLQVLDLSNNLISSKGASKIAELTKVNECIRKIDISQNAIHDDGVKYIGYGLHQNTTLQELNLSKNGIGDDGATDIAEALLENKHLLKLDMSQNAISDNGVRDISDSLKCNIALQELSLSKNRISDKGVKNIAKAIVENKALKTIDLSHNITSDNAKRATSFILENKNTIQFILS